LTFNSDFPGETLNPFSGMYAAETRKTQAGLPAGGWFPMQCVSREEALKAYTREAAYSEFTEAWKGLIRKGYLADFIILSDDIASVQPEELLSLSVEKTYVGGRCVYDQKALPE
jgi:predicted amidohydrolase YtcJ